MANAVMEKRQMKFDRWHAKDIASKMPWFTRLLLRLFARRLNRGLFSPLLNRAYSLGYINSEQLHVLHSQLDPTQDGVVGLVAR
jgi:hypothetical protein